MALKSSSVNSAIKEGNLHKRSNGDHQSVIEQVCQLAWQELGVYRFLELTQANLS